MRTARTLVRRPPRAAAVAISLALVGMLAGCAPAAPAEGPAAAVDQALDRLAAKDLDGLRALACAGQEDRIRERLGLAAAAGSEVLPGVEASELVDAVGFDVSGVELGEPVIDGDVAQVRVGGEVKVTFDKEAMRPLVRRMLEQQGRDVTDAQLDTVLDGLAAFGQEIPLDESIRLVREAGAWKLCEET